MSASKKRVSAIKVVLAACSFLVGMVLSFFWTQLMMNDLRYMAIIFTVVSVAQFAFTPVFKSMGLYRVPLSYATGV